MRLTGFICQDDYLSKTAKLSDEELGKLFRALMKYHESGSAPELDARIDIAFDFIKEDIDRAEESYSKKCEQASANRKKGLENRTEDNVRQRPSTSVKSVDIINNSQIKEKKNIENIYQSSSSSSFIDDDAAAAIQSDHDQVLNAAETAGFPRTDAVRAAMLELFSEYGLNKMLYGIKSCVEYGAVNIAYLKAVLKGSPKKGKPPSKTVVAQEYGQRDYSGVDAEIRERQNRKMEEFLRQRELERGAG